MYLKVNEDNKKLVEEFGASRITELRNLPDFYTFTNGLIYSHRDFDTFMGRLHKGVASAIVSGLNPSATLHLGHVPLFETNLFFQQKYGIEVFIPLSDDESYVARKIETQAEGFKNSIRLARSLLAFGFDLSKTHFIIDQVYTQIYNLAIKLSRGVNISEIKAVYGYSAEQNVGLHFYPAVQASHIALPQTLGIPNVLVPIGPDEDAHLRVARDIASKFGFNKAAALHMLYLPGLDGDIKMSKSKGNAVFLLDSEREIKKEIMSAFSGGKVSAEEHRRLGGDPSVDIPYLYLRYLFLKPKEAEEIAEKYRRGEILSGEMKQMLFEKAVDRTRKFQEHYNKITIEDVMKTILTNKEEDLRKMVEDSGVF
ncbi:MAG: tryptophan--tRNA ligase [Candidatus Micrarchaeaceae archaeon]